MAARNPTSFTNWIDETWFRRATKIRDTEFDKAVDDQIYLLDSPMISVSMAGWRFGTTSASFVEVRRFYVDHKDVCDVSDIANNETLIGVWAKCWESDGSTTGEVQLTTSASVGNNTVSRTFTGLTATWIDVDNGTGIYGMTNGEEDLLTLSLKRNAGSGTVYCDALLVYALET